MKKNIDYVTLPHEFIQWMLQKVKTDYSCLLYTSRCV